MDPNNFVSLSKDDNFHALQFYYDSFLNELQ